MIRHEQKGVHDCRGEGGIRRFLQKLLLLQEELERKNANGGGASDDKKGERNQVGERNGFGSEWWVGNI